MKIKNLTALLYCCAILAFSCSKKPKVGYSSIKLDDFFELKMGGSAVVADQDLKLTLTGVPEDSRCPKFVNCIQEGKVVITVSAAIDGKAQVVEMSRKPSDKSPTSATIGGFKLQLYDVMPYPENGKKTLPTDYSARFAIRKAG